MKLYVCHSGDFEYQTELYEPLRNSMLDTEHEILLPHDGGGDVNTKDMIQGCDGVIAEISYPSTGQGIELGWADAYGKPILAFYKKDSDHSRSTGYIAKKMIEYTDTADMITEISTEVERLLKSQ